MKLGIRNQKDLAAGVLYVLFGATFSLGALQYKLGDPSRMGPGWFPFWVGVLLVIVGAFTALGGLRVSATPEKIKAAELRPLAWVIGAVVLFGQLLQPLGMVAALAVLVVVASRASHEFTWTGALASAVALVLFSAAVFIWGINLQIPLWPAFLR
jgi:hypothetical protein